MKILSITIEQFGALRNLSLDFSSGINLIEGHNESGKSTLALFFLTMLYGPVRLNTWGLDLRRRALPMGKDYAYGKMTLLYQDQEALLERKIGRTRKEDFVRFTQKGSGRQLPFEEPLGYTFFGLDADTFMKTLFIAQEETRFTFGKEDALLRKLLNLVDSGEEEVSVEEALRALTKEEKSITNGKKTGELDHLLSSLEKAYGFFTKAKKELNQRKDHEAQLDTWKKTKQELLLKKEAQEALMKKVALYQVKDEFYTLKNQLQELKEVKKEKAPTFTMLPQETLTNIETLLKELEEITDAVMEGTEEEERLRRSIQEKDEVLASSESLSTLSMALLQKLTHEEIEERALVEHLAKVSELKAATQYPGIGWGLKRKLRAYERHLKRLQKPASRMMLYGGSLVFVVLWFVQPYGWPLLLTLFLFMGWVPFSTKHLRRYHLHRINVLENTLRRKAEGLQVSFQELLQLYSREKALQKPTENQEAMAQRWEEIKSHRQRIFHHTGIYALRALEEAYLHYEHSLKEQANMVHAYQMLQEKNALKLARKNLVEKELLWLLETHGSTMTKEELPYFLETYGLQERRWQYLVERELALTLALKGLLGDQDLEEVEEDLASMDLLGFQEPPQIEELREKKEALEEEAKEVDLNMEALSRDMEALFSGSLLVLEEDILEKKQQVDQHRKRLSIIALTKDLLLEAQRSFQKNHLVDLHEDLKRTFERLTKKVHPVVLPGENPSKRTLGEDLFTEKDLSWGTLAQLYFSFRLILIKRFFKEEPIPVFLDETFSSYDEERLKESIHLLKTEKEHLQVFLFTCHKREGQLLEGEANHLYL